MDSYLREIKEIADQLTIASASIHDEDLVLLTLNGLPREYDSLKTTIRARPEPITMDELSSLLCSEEIHIESESKSSSDLTVAFAATNISSTPSSQFQSGGTNNGGRSQNYRGGRSNTQGNRGEKYYNRGGRRGGRSHNQPNVICQICGEENHSALECWYRLDTSYSATNSASNSSNSSSTLAPRAYVASYSPLPQPNWYVDSAATSHITNDLQNLQNYHPYKGHDLVTVGNGNSLQIQNTVHNSGQDYEESFV